MSVVSVSVSACESDADGMGPADADAPDERPRVSALGSTVDSGLGGGGQDHVSDEDASVGVTQVRTPSAEAATPAVRVRVLLRGAYLTFGPPRISRLLPLHIACS